MDVIARLLEMKWADVLESWEHHFKSNSRLRVLDLECPGTVSLHACFNILDDSVLYLLIVLDAGTDLSFLDELKDYNVQITESKGLDVVTICHKKYEEV